MRFIFLLFCFFSCAVFADINVPIYATSHDKIIKKHKQNKKSSKKEIGTIIFKNTVYGLMIIPNLHGLSPGLHGFHIHDKPSCAHQGVNAAGHYDPNKTGKHLGPYHAEGHLGDLPALFVNEQGNAIHPILAPRLTEKDLYGHAIIIHEKGDNYADDPKPLGGGESRIACGVVKSISTHNNQVENKNAH